MTYALLSVRLESVYGVATLVAWNLTSKASAVLVLLTLLGDQGCLNWAL